MTHANTLTEADVLALLKEYGAYLDDLHVVYASGKHGCQYINKDAVLPHVAVVSRLCEELARRTVHLEPEVVVGPVAGAVALAQWLAHHLSALLGRTVLAVYADRRHEEYEMVYQEHTQLLTLADTLMAEWPKGAEERTRAADALRRFVAAVRARPTLQDTFVLKRGYDVLAAEKRVLVVEDVINTGGSIRGVAIAAACAGAEIVGGCCLVNRGGQTAETLRFPAFIALLHMKMDAWDEHELPDWLRDRPIATHVGKGRASLAKKGAR